MSMFKVVTVEEGNLFTRTMKGGGANDRLTEVAANFTAKEANAKAEELGIKTRYQAVAADEA